MLAEIAPDIGVAVISLTVPSAFKITVLPEVMAPLAVAVTVPPPDGIGSYVKLAPLIAGNAPLPSSFNILLAPDVATSSAVITP